MTIHPYAASASLALGLLTALLVALLAWRLMRRFPRGTVFHRSGRTDWGVWPVRGWSSRGWSQNEWGSGSGGLRGGGGRFGGGGASGSWQRSTTPTEFINQLDESWIVGAIAKAERQSCGEIRVFVSQRAAREVLAEAQQQFAQLGLAHTGRGTAVLLCFAPRSLQFAVVGDVAVHEKCGEVFWQEVSALLRERLQSGQLTEAIVEAIGKIGQLLARHFPREPDARRELPAASAREPAERSVRVVSP